MLRRRIRFSFFFLGILLIGILVFAGSKMILHSMHPNEAKYMQVWDDSTRQSMVFSHQGIDSVLDGLESVGYDVLPQDYLKNTATDEKKDVLQWKQFYKLKGMDIYRYVTARFRIKDFMSKDTFYEQNLETMPVGIDQYWLMDRSVLHKFLDLILWMKEQGYNDSAISINNGHRNPNYNKKVGGVSHSYHMQGVAIDLKVGDINRDGIADAKDKDILLRKLDTDIIGDIGGLGKYPETDVIHFDTRGYRARWDRQ